MRPVDGNGEVVDKRPLKTDFRGRDAQTSGRTAESCNGIELGKARGAYLLCNRRGPERQGLEEKKRKNGRLASTKSLTLRRLARGKGKTEGRRNKRGKTRKSSLVLEEEEEGGRRSEKGVGEETGG